MKLRLKRVLVFAIVVSPLWPGVSLNATTIAEVTGGTFEQTSTDFRGQSFTTKTEDNYNNIAFNLFSRSMVSAIGNPYAQGTGYLFSVPFAGLRSDMSNTSPGFLGLATAGSGFWTFAPGVTLLGGTQYFFYMSDLSNFITGGEYYEGGSRTILSGGGPSQPWPQNSSPGISYNFRVTGTPVPETGTTLWLLGLGAFGLFGWRRLTRTWSP
jgi:hypothetical protein